MSGVPRELLGLGHLTRLVDSGLPLESLRDWTFPAGLDISEQQRQEVLCALDAFSTLLSRGTGIQEVWDQVERSREYAARGYSRAMVLEQLSDHGCGAGTWVGAGALIEKALHSSAKYRITAKRREIQTKVTDPRKAGQIEESGHGKRKQAWYFGRKGKALALHRDINAVWSAHEVGDRGEILRRSDHADVSGHTALREALFEDKLIQLSSITAAHAGAKVDGHFEALPRLERAAADAYDLLLALVEGAEPDSGSLRAKLSNHHIGVLKAPEPSGEQWFIDKFGYRKALHLPESWRLHEASIQKGRVDLSVRKEIFEDLFTHYQSLVSYLGFQLCPPEARTRMEQSVREHKAALERVMNADATREERNWSRDVKGRIFAIDYADASLRLVRGRELRSLQFEIRSLSEAGKDHVHLAPRLEQALAAYESEVVQAQPKVSLDSLLGQVNELLGRPPSTTMSKASAPAAPTRAQAEQAYDAYVQSFQTGIRSQQDMRVLEAALLDPDVTIVERTPIKGGVNEVELVKLSNGLNAIFKPSSGERIDSLRELVEPGFMARREHAAYLVDKLMGHHAGAPPSIRRALEGRVGCLQLFVPGQSASQLGFERIGKYGDRESTLNEHVTQASKRPVALFDQVIGNLDRHGGNFLLAPTGTSFAMVPIDHGLSFPLANTRLDSSSVLEDRHRLTPADLSALDSLVARRGELVAELLELEIDPRAILAMFERIGELRLARETARDWSNRGARGP